ALLRGETLHVELDAGEELTLLLVLLKVSALAEVLDELRHVRRHLVEATRTRRLRLRTEDVESFEVELSREDTGVVIRMVERDVTETESSLFPVLSLEVG